MLNKTNVKKLEEMERIKELIPNANIIFEKIPTKEVEKVMEE